MVGWALWALCGLFMFNNDLLFAANLQFCDNAEEMLNLQLDVMPIDSMRQEHYMFEGDHYYLRCHYVYKKHTIHTELDSRAREMTEFKFSSTVDAVLTTNKS